MAPAQALQASAQGATATALAPGFADPVPDAQRTFSALMWAMAEPGRIVPFAAALTPPAPLSPEMAAAALALLDYETPFFLDAHLAATPEVERFLSFHTGAPRVADSRAARFAFIGDGAALPDFSHFAAGEADYPDRSATLIVAVAEMGDGPLTLEGPGIAGRRGFGAAPLPEDFAARLQANHAGFPLGVDLVLCAPGRLAALPRSVVPVGEG